MVIGNELFKKTVEGVMLKWHNENKAFVAISSVHSATCGSHQAGHKTKWLMFQQGLYWPSMLKDCINFEKGCQECQKHVGIRHVPASELHSIIKPWPFGGWALDVIDEIHPNSSKGHRFVLARIDYFTKWIEVVPLQNVDQKVVISFIKNYILCRFEVPENITTDQGSAFIGQKTVEFTKQAGFKVLTLTPYYAQADGQVEAANKAIIDSIKRRMNGNSRNWHVLLDQIPWACRTSPKKSINSTPFRLVFGHDLVLSTLLIEQASNAFKFHLKGRCYILSVFCNV